MINRNMTRVSKVKPNESGQVLLFVVVAMTIALALGVGVSLETISSISRVADVDTSQKAAAAAEGAAERALSLSEQDLITLRDNVAAGCNILKGTMNGSDCKISFTSADGLNTQAIVSVAQFNFVNNGDDTFSVNDRGIKQVFLDGVSPKSVKLCWPSQDKIDLYVTIANAYQDTKEVGLGRYARVITSCDSGACGTPTPTINPHAVAKATTVGTETCYTVQYPGDFPTIFSSVNNRMFKHLRMRTLQGSTNVTVSLVESNGSLSPLAAPVRQGFEIVTVGTLDNDPSIKRTVRVRRSDPYVHGIFDFATYGESKLGMD